MQQVIYKYLVLMITMVRNLEIIRFLITISKYLSLQCIGKTVNNDGIISTADRSSLKTNKSFSLIKNDSKQSSAKKNLQHITQDFRHNDLLETSEDILDIPNEFEEEDDAFEHPDDNEIERPTDNETDHPHINVQGFSYKIQPKENNFVSGGREEVKNYQVVQYERNLKSNRKSNPSRKQTDKKISNAEYLMSVLNHSSKIISLFRRKQSNMNKSKGKLVPKPSKSLRRSPERIAEISTISQAFSANKSPRTKAVNKKVIK